MFVAAFARNLLTMDPLQQQSQPLSSECQDPCNSSGRQHEHSGDDNSLTQNAHNAQEQKHWEDVCRAYRQYATFAMAQFTDHQYRLHAIPGSRRKFLPPALRMETPEFQDRSKSFKDAAIRNQFCLDCILRHASQPNSQDLIAAKNRGEEIDMDNPTDSQMSKVSSVLKSLARDWSEECKKERDMAYAPMLEQVQHYLPVPHRYKKPKSSLQMSSPEYVPKLCVPGAGVGRLACELAALGYSVQGNEVSLYMLLASDFILNGRLATPEHPLRISPWLLESRNVQNSKDQTRSMTIPDVDPFKMILPDESLDVSGDSTKKSETKSFSEPAEFSMAAGEFLSIYSSPKEAGQWDGFVACFFLDTAPSIVEYITAMHQALKPGGFVFNFGPLLWHWSGPPMRPDDNTWSDYEQRYNHMDGKYLSSIDLSWEDVRGIFVNVGFDIVFEQAELPALYTADQKSMMYTHYRCVHFVARKTETPALDDTADSL